MASLARFHIILYILLSVLPLNSFARTPHSCYWGVNKLAPDDFLPCYGSSKTSQYSCCQAGDKCLEGNACYDSNTGVTYQYGCTDRTFKDPHCPQKCNLDTSKSHWVGLIFCNGSNKAPNDTWVCHHPDNCGNRGTCSSQIWGDTIQRQLPTACEDVKHEQDYVALETIGSIRDLVPLPPPTQTASWWSANEDRYKTVTSSIATPILVTTTLVTMPAPRDTVPAIQSNLMSTPTTPSTPSATQPPDSGPSGPDLRVVLPPSIILPLALIGFLWWLIKKYARCMIKRVRENDRREKSSSPMERPTAHSTWDRLKNAVHPIWWPFDDMPSDRSKTFKDNAEAIKKAAHKSWEQLCQGCTEKIDSIKSKLKKHHEKDESSAAAASHEPKPKLDTSPVPESPAPSAASDIASLPARVPLHVKNGGCESPIPTVPNRRGGLVDSLQLHRARLAV